MNRADVKRQINPHLHDMLPIEDEHEIVDIAPEDLLPPKRFYLAAKALYAHHGRLGTRCTWARIVYEKHLDAWCGLEEHLSLTPVVVCPTSWYRA